MDLAPSLRFKCRSQPVSLSAQSLGLDWKLLSVCWHVVWMVFGLRDFFDLYD